MKRLISLLLVLAMALSLLCTVSAASPEATEAADALHDLGLFQGVGTNQDGTPNYDLDRAPNRYEAVTMLVRLLGKEEEAKAGTWNTPFTDVAEWAKPYVGYAYDNGLTNGISADKFGGTNLVTASQYITFVLRALGYESGTDFKWDTAWELSDKLGITNGEYTASSSFDRGNVVIISYRSLDAVIVCSGETLLDWLEETGAITSPNPDVGKKEFRSFGGYPSLVKYQGKTYSIFSTGFNILNLVYSLDTLEPYGYDSFSFLFQDLKSMGSDNPYIDGILYTDNYKWEEGALVAVSASNPSNLGFVHHPKCEKFKYTSKYEYISATDSLLVFTLQANGKTFKSITTEEFLSAGLKDGDTGVWNGVHYYVESIARWTYVDYNLNDLAKYFGLDRTFHIEIGDEAYLVIK